MNDSIKTDIRNTARKINDNIRSETGKINFNQQLIWEKIYKIMLWMQL